MRGVLMAISTVSKPHCLNCRKKLGALVVNGEVNRNVLMPSLIVRTLYRRASATSNVFPPLGLHFKTRQAARRRQRHRHAQIEDAAAARACTRPASASASGAPQSARGSMRRLNSVRLRALGPPPPGIRQFPENPRNTSSTAVGINVDAAHDHHLVRASQHPAGQRRARLAARARTTRPRQIARAIAQQGRAASAPSTSIPILPTSPDGVAFPCASTNSAR